MNNKLKKKKNYLTEIGALTSNNYMSTQRMVNIFQWEKSLTNFLTKPMQPHQTIKQHMPTSFDHKTSSLTYLFNFTFWENGN